MKKALYITVSHASYLDVLSEDASAGGESNWTVSRHARPGDGVALYLTAPISAIVAVARVSSIPVREDDPQSAWHGHFMADFEIVEMIPQRITRDALRGAFPAWGYWKQPRLSVRVPAEYQGRLTIWMLSGK